MILRKSMPCMLCEGWGDLHWETVSQNDLTVHNVPIYRCANGHEWHELCSATVYDAHVKQAYERNAEEITLVYPDVTLLEWDEPIPKEVEL